MYVSFKNRIDLFIHNSVILTSVRKKNSPVFALHNSGMIFVNPKLPKAAIVHELSKNLSIIDWDNVRLRSPRLTCLSLVKQIPSGISPHTNSGYIYIPSVKVIKMDRLFIFKDSDGNKMDSLYDGQVAPTSGQARPLDLDKE